jgi:hypothetical protein
MVKKADESINQSTTAAAAAAYTYSPVLIKSGMILLPGGEM